MDLIKANTMKQRLKIGLYTTGVGIATIVAVYAAGYLLYTHSIVGMYKSIPHL